jgi:hypothetical protein
MFIFHFSILKVHKWIQILTTNAWNLNYYTECTALFFVFAVPNKNIICVFESFEITKLFRVIKSKTLLSVMVVSRGFNIVRDNEQFEIATFDMIRNYCIIFYHIVLENLWFIYFVSL